MTAKKNADELVQIGGVAGLGIPVGKIIDGIRHVATCLKEIAEQHTEQARIEAEARTEVERIRADRDVLMHYLDRTFDERRKNFGDLFSGLDRALDSNDIQAVSSILDAIVQMADSSPFKALKDIKATQEVLKDKNKEWDL